VAGQSQDEKKGPQIAQIFADLSFKPPKGTLGRCAQSSEGASGRCVEKQADAANAQTYLRRSKRAWIFPHI